MEAIDTEYSNMIVAVRPSKYDCCSVEQSSEYEGEGMHGRKMSDMFSYPRKNLGWIFEFLCFSAILKSGVPAPPLM